MDPLLCEVAGCRNSPAAATAAILDSIVVRHRVTRFEVALFTPRPRIYVVSAAVNAGRATPKRRCHMSTVNGFEDARGPDTIEVILFVRIRRILQGSPLTQRIILKTPCSVPPLHI